MEQAQDIQAAVVRKARHGDTEAMGWLYKQYCKAMFNICLRMSGNRNDAEDILQEAFIIAFDKLHQLKEEMQFGGWLKRIVVNECIHYSKKSFYWEDWEDKNEETFVEDEIAWWKTTDLQVIHNEIKTLPGGCRQIFNLYVLENYSHREIAESLGISESTSKTQYQRARKLLRERITKKLETYG